MAQCAYRTQLRQVETHTNSVQNAPMVDEPDLDDTRTDEARRLMEARRARGFAEAKAAAAYFGWNYYTYSQHERGERGLRKIVAERYAKAYRVTASWLLTGQGTRSSGETAVVGYVGADSRPDVVLFNEIGEGYAHDFSVPLPPDATSTTVALEVRGNSMRGIAKDGWNIYYDQNDIREPPSEDLYGELCICWLEDGKALFKELHPGRGDGYFDLESMNAPTIRDAFVRRAVRVTFIRPQGRRPNTDQLSVPVELIDVQKS